MVGGAGYVGGELARHFSKHHKVVILDIVEPSWDLGQGNCVFRKCDIRDYEAVRDCISDSGLIIHTAVIQIPRINSEAKLGYEVNLIGTQNVCRAVSESKGSGLILTSSWHTIGERDISGTVNEEFGFRPDKVEDRAKLYTLSKIAQESIVRYYDAMSDKVFGIIRMGTVLGIGMPEVTAANTFIDRGLKGETLTPFKHSMHRPMLYVDIQDVCTAFESFADKILGGASRGSALDFHHIFNVYCPEPITIIELANIVSNSISKHSDNRLSPVVKVVDKGLPQMFDLSDKEKMTIDVSRAKEELGLVSFLRPADSVDRIIEYKMSH